MYGISIIYSKLITQYSYMMNLILLTILSTSYPQFLYYEIKTPTTLLEFLLLLHIIHVYYITDFVF